MKNYKLNLKNYILNKRYLIFLLIFNILSCTNTFKLKMNSNKNIHSNLNSSNILNNENQKEGEYDTIDSDKS